MAGILKLLLTDVMTRPASDEMRYAPRSSTRFEAQKIKRHKETGNDEDWHHSGINDRAGKGLRDAEPRGVGSFSDKKKAKRRSDRIGHLGVSLVAPISRQT